MKNTTGDLYNSQIIMPHNRKERRAVKANNAHAKNKKSTKKINKNHWMNPNIIIVLFIVLFGIAGIGLAILLSSGIFIPKCVARTVGIILCVLIGILMLLIN